MIHLIRSYCLCLVGDCAKMAGRRALRAVRSLYDTGGSTPGPSGEAGGRHHLRGGGGGRPGGGLGRHRLSLQQQQHQSPRRSGRKSRWTSRLSRERPSCRPSTRPSSWTSTRPSSWTSRSSGRTSRRPRQEVPVPPEPRVSTNEVRRAYLSGRYLRLYARSFDPLGKST